MIFICKKFFWNDIILIYVNTIVYGLILISD